MTSDGGVIYCKMVSFEMERKRGRGWSIFEIQVFHFEDYAVSVLSQYKKVLLKRISSKKMLFIGLL